MTMKKDKYYIEFECHLDNPMTEEEVVQFCNEFVEFTKKWQVYPPKCMIKKNPVYDSFGNLWE